MKKYLPLLFFLPATTGCNVHYSKPLQTGASDNNKTYTVQYLFEHEGCKVYRFRDGVDYVYFTNCNGEAIHKTDSTQVRNVIRISEGVKPSQ